MAESYINFATMTGFTREMVLSQIFKVLKVAGHYSGEVFGGFVRGVIGPREVDPNCDVTFKDVDLWFEDAVAADKFIDAMGDSFRQVDRFTRNNTEQPYAFDRRQYHYFQHDTCIAWFDVIVSKDFPVNDFDVNTLSYSYGKDGTVYSCTSYREIDIDVLKRRILAKEARMLEPLIEWFLKPDSHYQALAYGRIATRYSALGWKIMIGDTECCGFTSQNTFAAWVRATVTKVATPIVGSIKEETPTEATTSNQARILNIFDTKVATLRAEVIALTSKWGYPSDTEPQLGLDVSFRRKI